MYRVVIIFSHNTLARRWVPVKEILSSKGVALQVYGQADAVSHEWLAQADAVYSDVSQQAQAYSELLEYSKTHPGCLFAGSLDLAAETGHAHVAAVDAFKRFLLGAATEDLCNAVRLLLKSTGSLQADIPAPGDPILCGIACPESERLYDTVEAYVGTNTSHLVPILYGRRYWTGGDLGIICELMQAVRESGFIPVPVFCDFTLANKINEPDHPLRLLLDPVKARLAVILNMAVSSVSGKHAPDTLFQLLGVPVLQLIRNYTQTEEEWRIADDSLIPMTYNFSVAQPEILGVIEPQLIACNSEPKTGGETPPAKGVERRLQRLSGRIQRWARLQSIPNSEKRVAVLLSNAPCKGVESTLTLSSGLNSAESAVLLMRRLQTEGYVVEEIPETGDALLQLIRDRKAHCEFRWTHVEHTVEKGGALAFIDETEYNRNFHKLPESVQEAVNNAWDPFPAKAMVHTNSSGNESLVITGLRFGNVSVLIEPKRGCYGTKCNGEVCRILHQPDIPPTHHWLATYWYLQEHFDALVHMGTGSSLDFLPGKRSALTDDCYSEISLGELPRFYPYVMNSVGEALLAKRRGRAVMLSHLSAPLKSVGKTLLLNELEDLHRQWVHAQENNDLKRGTHIAEVLQTRLLETAMIPVGLSGPAFSDVLGELPRRIQAMRSKRLEHGKHVFGSLPDEAALQLYLDEARNTPGFDEQVFRCGLKKCKDEMDHLIEGLNGRFIRSAQAGAISSGRDHLLPTGRNLYAMDLRSIPTPSAWEVGQEMGTLLLRKYLNETGVFPRSIGMTLWSSDVFMSEGEQTAQILWLLGCRPVWDAQGHVKSIEAIPVGELTFKDETGAIRVRPRVDATVRMSGVVRDLLEQVYLLLDDAVVLVAGLDESEEVNYVRAHVLERMQELEGELQQLPLHYRQRLATGRLFTDSPSAYGNGINLAIDASAWKDDKDLANAYINWTGGLCGRGVSEAVGASGTEAVMRCFGKEITRVDISYQRAVSAAYDPLAMACYSGYSGGMAAIKRASGGNDLKCYWGDTHGDAPTVRGLGEEIDLALAARMNNPEWIAAKLEEGYMGVADLSIFANTLFAWSATTLLVEKRHFDRVYEVLVADNKVSDRLKELNPHAFEEITRRLMEAASRELWLADDDALEGLVSAALELEGTIEDDLGSFQGEIQGASVNIMTEEDVERWQWKKVIS
ncbi:MAG: cobaltochelatase subunit CobN [Opitutales bacterium]|nr:cobaltochelatase subunit CobN [Opitutales bacterium]